MVHLPVGVFGIEVSAQAALQDETVVAELTVQIPSVSSYNIFNMLPVPQSHYLLHCTLQMDCACTWHIHLPF